MIKAIIFDCWNTLFFTDLKPHPFSEFARKINKDLTKDYNFRKVFERIFMLEETNYADATKKLLKELKLDVEQKQYNELVETINRITMNIKPFPDVISNLAKLKKKYKLGLLTNTGVVGFNALKSIINVDDYFEIILKSYETHLIKPDPKIFELILKKLGVKASEALMVGDSLRDDVKAAEKIGIKAVLLDRKGKHPEYKNKITSLNQLEEYI